ncbi:hypothetical protein C2U69_09730 [Cupriavidus pinatubonensis]|nr:hypothetical protein C2U69_09730 [Cupriavidus pinatubonensis]
MLAVAITELGSGSDTKACRQCRQPTTGPGAGGSLLQEAPRCGAELLVILPARNVPESKSQSMLPLR